MKQDKRSVSQRWADAVTEFSGSWTFIFWFSALSGLWILINIFHVANFDPYPFLFLNWILTVVSTLQNPVILLSQNRQNDMDRERVSEMTQKLDEIIRRLDYRNDV